MLESFAIAASFIGVAFFIYKWFEVLILKKERLEIISRLDGEGLVEYLMVFRSRIRALQPKPIPSRAPARERDLEKVPVTRRLS